MTIKPYTDKAHQRYYVKGKRVSGASTIAKLGRDSKQIQDWAYQMGLDGLDKNEYFAMSGRVGTIGHAVLQAHVLGADLDLTGYSQPDIELGTMLGKKFCAKWDRSGLELVASELSLTSEALGYGGTLDLLAVRENEPTGDYVLIDAKTSKGIYSNHAFQVAGGYRKLWECHNPDKPITSVEIWCFSKEGKNFLLELSGEALEMAWDVFAAQLVLLNALKKWENR